MDRPERLAALEKQMAQEVANRERAGIRQCAAGHDHEVKTIGLHPAPGETQEDAYARWCRGKGRNPWCYSPLSECPER